MTKINVIDLDKTLIPFDSFRYFILEQIKAKNIKAFLYTLLRLLRILSGTMYKKIIIRCTNLEHDDELVIKVSDFLYNSIDDDILTLVKDNTDKNTINIICSGSPDSYVVSLAKKLKWIGYGSKYLNDQFVNMLGTNKLRFILKTYPPNKYEYNFSISDNKSDIKLLKKFNKYVLLHQGNRSVESSK